MTMLLQRGIDGMTRVGKVRRHSIGSAALACALINMLAMAAQAAAAAGVDATTTPVVVAQGASCPPVVTANGILICDAGRAMPPFVSRFVRDRFLRRYSWAVLDLDGDGRLNGLVYAVATSGGGEADLCGSGGCKLYVLSPAGAGYRIVGDMSVAQLPVRILPQVTSGWHDLGVEVGGGGIVNGYEARLRFEGTHYASNPTVPPAARSAGRGGVVAIRAMPPPVGLDNNGPLAPSRNGPTQ